MNVFLLVGMIVGLTGCVGSPVERKLDGHENTRIGAAIGAGTGGVVGALSSDEPESVVLGVVFGGLIGAGLGAAADNAQPAYEEDEALTRSLAPHAAQVHTLGIQSIDVARDGTSNWLHTRTRFANGRTLRLQQPGTCDFVLVNARRIGFIGALPRGQTATPALYECAAATVGSVLTQIERRSRPGVWQARGPVETLSLPQRRPIVPN